MIRFLKPSLMAIAATAMLLVSSSAMATTIPITPPELLEFTGPSASAPGEILTTPQLVGAFLYSVPTGEGLTFGSFKSSFGNSDQPGEGGTALMQVFVNGILVGACTNVATACFDPPFNTPVPFTYTFTQGELALLANGPAVLTILQSPFNQFDSELRAVRVRLGESSLTLVSGPADLASTPEPASLTLMAIGLTGAVSTAWRRRRCPRPDA